MTRHFDDEDVFDLDSSTSTLGVESVKRGSTWKISTFIRR